MTKNSLLPWEKRSMFIANLYNPAFLGLLLQRVIFSYKKKCDKDFPFTLVYFVLPLVLYHDSCSVIPKRGGLNGEWLNKAPEIKASFNLRLTQLLPYTQEAIMFLLSHKSVSILDNGTILLAGENIYLENEDTYSISKYLEASDNLGKRMALHKPAEIYQLFGIKP